MFLAEVNNEKQALWLSLITILIYFALMYLKKKLIGKNETKGVHILNIVINVIMLGALAVMFIFLSGYEFSFEKFSRDFVAFLTDQMNALIGSIFVIIISLTLYNMVKIIVLKSNEQNRPNKKRKATLGNVLLSFLRYTLYIIDIAILLSIWGIDIAPILAGLGIAGLVIGLGAQKLITDFISGLFIVFERHFDVGDIIAVGGFKGEVIDIGLKTTRIKDWRGDVKLISNGSIEEVINYSMYQSVAVVEFELSYKEDVGKTIEYINNEIVNHLPDLPSILTKPAVVGTIGFRTNGVAIRVTATTLPEQHYGVERAIIRAIKEICDEHKIEIPVNQLRILRSDENDRTED